MDDRPILFSAPMVSALLAGAKTQTRRVVKPQPTHFVGGPGVTDAAGNPWPRQPAIDEQSCSLVIRCPHGQPGDRLYVRETWAAPHADDHLPPRLIPQDARIHYAATEDRGGLLWRPSIHMPRWASRITLEVTGVRVERLQAITPADAIAEGCPGGDHGDRYAAVEQYRALWESINGHGSWASNPWVWVVEFARATTPQAEGKP